MSHDLKSLNRFLWKTKVDVLFFTHLTDFHQKQQESEKKDRISGIKEINPRFGGFATAKGSQLKISAETLKKARLIFGDDIDLNKGPPETDSLKKRKLSGECSDPHNSKKVCLSNSEDPFKDDFVIDTQDLEMAERMAFERDKTIPLPVSW